MDITFEDFFNYFGCDLVITGTNVSQHVPRYFSVHTTPSFPVIDAVCLSMNLPLIFKPIYVDLAVHKYRGNKDSEYNLKYKGLWVDGGMLNNYPVHAFNRFENFSYNGATGGFNFLTDVNHIGWGVAANDVASDLDINDKVIGFRLVDFSETKKVDENEIFNKTDYFNVFPYMLDLLGTFMYSGSQGQIRNDKEQKRTIYINSEGLSVVDFSPLRQGFAFGKGNKRSVNKEIVKEGRIEEAYNETSKRIF
jgi:NTE family protein